MKKLIFLFVFISFWSCSESNSVNVLFEPTSPQISFGGNSLMDALKSKSYVMDTAASFTIHFKIEESCCESQGFKIIPEKNQIIILSADENGLMYGGLELAELIKIGKSLNQIEQIEEKPYIQNRGIKFNIPLDVRTSSFDDSGDAAQNNIAEMWDMAFWEDFFDNMATHRYNAISFWNAHPFSSMVQLEDYPDVALQDVCGTTIKPQENSDYWNILELPSSKIVANLKVLKKMTIDEKIKFWQDVMAYAKGRGIDVYFMTWNICLNGAALPGPNWEVGDKLGKYGISNDYTNETSKDYLRKSVEQFLLNYPDVKGIGVTAGENMREPMNDEDKEKWLWETYGLGILDAKKQQPNRTVNFIHRFWWTDMDMIMKYWGNYPDPFDMSFKYAKAHMYSAVSPPFHKPLLDWMKPQNLKSWWNLRNDDIFIHRWGDPEFVRDFIKNLPADQTAGYHMGSDGYVWGREFISKSPNEPRTLEIEKNWFRFLLWGRMGYNPEMDESRILGILNTKFPEVDAKALVSTWSAASKIIPQVNRFHWRDWDYMWQPEACMDHRSDLRDVNAFRITHTMEDSGILNPVDYVEGTISGAVINQITPLDVADNLSEYAKAALDGAANLLTDQTTKELEQTLLDIKAMGHLGDYYANKIRGAIALEFYKQTGAAEHQTIAVDYLEQASDNWEAYTAVDDPRYSKQNFARLRTFDYQRNLELTKVDVQLAKDALTYAQDPESRGEQPIE